ncbi:hypothetical protein NN561_020321 [Cricetulus griseus]
MMAPRGPPQTSPGALARSLLRRQRAPVRSSVPWRLRGAHHPGAAAASHCSRHGGDSPAGGPSPRGVPGPSGRRPSGPGARPSELPPAQDRAPRIN